jgi:hypothetical protein
MIGCAHISILATPRTCRPSQSICQSAGSLAEVVRWLCELQQHERHAIDDSLRIVGRLTPQILRSPTATTITQHIKPNPVSIIPDFSPSFLPYRPSMNSLQTRCNMQYVIHNMPYYYAVLCHARPNRQIPRVHSGNCIVSHLSYFFPTSVLSISRVSLPTTSHTTVHCFSRQRVESCGYPSACPEGSDIHIIIPLLCGAVVRGLVLPSLQVSSCFSNRF